MNCRVSCKLPGARWTQTDGHVRPDEMQRATMSMHGDIGGEGAPLAALAMCWHGGLDTRRSSLAAMRQTRRDEAVATHTFS